MIVDFCTYLGQWPPYPLLVADVAGLVKLLDRCQIGVAFVSLLDGLFTFNPRESNMRLAEQVADHRDRLRPVGTLNPALPTWEDDLHHGIENLGMAGFRLDPGYHGYTLDDQEAVVAARAVGEHGLPLFLPVFVDEERFQHPALRVPPLSPAQIAGLIRAAVHTTVVVTNLAPEEAAWLLAQGDLPLQNAYFDVNAMDKPAGYLTDLINHFGAGRLVFGSQAPFLYPEATLALLLATGLPADAAAAVMETNWRHSPVLRRAILAPQ